MYLYDNFDVSEEDVYLTAERMGEPVNERHLASIRRAKAGYEADRLRDDNQMPLAA